MTTETGWHFTFPLFCVLAWIPLTLLMGALMAPRRALIISFVAGWLFLPNIMLPTPFVVLTKSIIVALATVLGSLLLDPARIWRFRPRWFDLPMLIWCLVPMAADLSNNMTFYDAASAAATNCFTWGLPYLLGRVYLYEPSGLKQLALALIAGGLIYVPFCLWEIRMSPRLHYDLYQFQATSNAFETSQRMGGWRPMVFLQTGLALGMFMAAATLPAVWFWWTGAVRQFLKVPMWVWALVLVITTILCHSLGSIVLLLVGLMVLLLSRRMHTRVLVFLFTLAAPIYLVVRITGVWNGVSAIDFITDLAGGERAQSVDFRMENEEKIASHAMEHPFLGWGRSDQFLLYDPYEGAAIPDGMWTIALGAYGLIGLVSFFSCLLLPTWVLLKSYSARTWTDASFAGVAALAVVLLLYSIDSLLNAMENPIFFLAVGGLTALAARQPVAAEPYPAAQAAPARAPSRQKKHSRPVAA